MEKLETQKNAIGVTWGRVGDKCNQKNFNWLSIKAQISFPKIWTLWWKNNLEYSKGCTQLHFSLLKSSPHKRWQRPNKSPLHISTQKWNLYYQN